MSASNRKPGALLKTQLNQPLNHQKTRTAKHGRIFLHFDKERWLDRLLTDNTLSSGLLRLHLHLFPRPSSAIVVKLGLMSGR